MPRPLPFPRPADAPDRALVERFAATGDGVAFAALVARHGPAVLGVCRRAVRDRHLAEDAFQATFLLLARKAGGLRDAAGVGSWLFGTARRVAANAARRERPWRAGGVSPPVATTVSDMGSHRGADAPRSPDPELLLALDEELARLPDRYRSPLVACYLHARTQEAAAASLGWSVSTLRRRLDRGRELLRARLTARGFAAAVGLLAAGPPAGLTAAVPPALLRITLELSLDARGGVVPPHLAPLMTEGLRVMSWKTAAAGLLAVVLVSAAAVGDAPPPAPAKWVTISGRVVLPADAPRPLVAVTADKEHCLSKGPLRADDVLVDAKTRGLRNVWVYLRPAAGGAFAADQLHPSLTAPKPVTHVVDQPCCQFVPRILAARAGDAIEFRNSSPIPHNVNLSADGVAFNRLAAPGQAMATAPLTAMPGPAEFACNIHPWMKGRFMVFDHPYYAVTDDQGRFEIRNAPAVELRIVYRHEHGYHKGRDGNKGFPLAAKADAGGAVRLPELAFEFPK